MTKASMSSMHTHERIPSERQSRIERLRDESGLTTLEMILIIGAALVILVLVIRVWFPGVWQGIENQVNCLLNNQGCK